MEFIVNYWAILLVALILVLLVLLVYLIDKKNHKLNELDNYQANEQQLTESNDDINNALEINNESKPLIFIDDTDKLTDNEINNISEELDYDELDIENIDAEFNRVISRKSVIDDSLKDSIDSIKIDPISFVNDNVDDSKIELPDIKL